jgi:hypothetical protein
MNADGLTTVYHVTNVQRHEAKPDWRFLQPSRLRDATYDGILVGLEAVSCSATLINGALPKWTPYPTGITPPAKLWRATSSVRLSDYSVFRMHEHRTGRGPRQVQLLLCKRGDEVEAAFAKALRALEFDELCAPDYGGYFDPDGTAPDYKGSEWINLLFLGKYAQPAELYWRRYCVSVDFQLLTIEKGVLVFRTLSGAADGFGRSSWKTRPRLSLRRLQLCLLFQYARVKVSVVRSH